MVAIKICGIATPPTLEAAIEGKAAYLGFNFHPLSPRHVALAAAAALSRQAAGRIARVGLFVNAAPAVLVETVAAAQLDVLQFHGDESPAQLQEIRRQFGLPVWKAVAIAGPDDLARANRFAGAADLVLLDAKTPPGAMTGGMGLSFDWALLAAWKPALAWGLAGGLRPENVAQAIAMTGTALVDTSSGVESAPGIKDPERIRAFCQAVAQA